MTVDCCETSLRSGLYKTLLSITYTCCSIDFWLMYKINFQSHNQNANNWYRILILHQQFCMSERNQQTKWIHRMWRWSCYEEIQIIRRGPGLKRTGRPKKLSPGCQVDPSLVWRSLIRNDLCGRVAANKPHFHEGNMVKSLRYAKSHKDCYEDQWKRVLWIDESKFEMSRSICQQYVRRWVGDRWKSECLNPSVKYCGVI